LGHGGGPPTSAALPGWPHRRSPSHFSAILPCDFKRLFPSLTVEVGEISRMKLSAAAISNKREFAGSQQDSCSGSGRVQLRLACLSHTRAWPPATRRPWTLTRQVLRDTAQSCLFIASSPPEGRVECTRERGGESGIAGAISNCVVEKSAVTGDHSPHQKNILVSSRCGEHWAVIRGVVSEDARGQESSAGCW
jgi:hypothetical protein